MPGWDCLLVTNTTGDPNYANWAPTTTGDAQWWRRGACATAATETLQW